MGAQHGCWKGFQTVRGLFVRKSNIQLQSGLLKPCVQGSCGENCVECWTEISKQHSEVGVGM